MDTMTTGKQAKRHETPGFTLIELLAATRPGLSGVVKLARAERRH
jgi:hypothetical protein